MTSRKEVMRIVWERVEETQSLFEPDNVDFLVYSIRLDLGNTRIVMSWSLSPQTLRCQHAPGPIGQSPPYVDFGHYLHSEKMSSRFKKSVNNGERT